MHMPVSAEPRASARVRMIMIICLLPLLALTVVGLVLLWPTGPGPTLPGGGPLTATAPGVSSAEARVVSVDASNCPAEATDPAALTECTTYRAVAGGQEGSLYVTPEAVSSGITVGDEIKVLDFTKSPDRDLVDQDYVFVDYDRDVPLTALAVIYVIVVLLVAAVRGFRALIGLGFAGVVVLTFMLPAILDGGPPILVAMVAASAIMMIALYLAHGISTRTTTALFGTVLGIALTGGLGYWMTSWAHLGVAYTEEDYILGGIADVPLGALIVSAIIVTGLGVLNDVTITQASAVWELATVAPDLRARQLFARAMRIGRDHIASTVYTITFAYVGSALTTLVIVSAHHQSFLETLTRGEMAVEVVGILVCSIGLVIAIPLTTALGVIVVKSGVRPVRQPAEAGVEYVAEAGDGSGAGQSAEAGDAGGAGAALTRREARRRDHLGEG